MSVNVGELTKSEKKEIYQKNITEQENKTDGIPVQKYERHPQ